MTSVDPSFLERFEAALDPARPEASGTEAQVIGFGEISAVLQPATHPDWVLKRMAGFRSDVEAEAYAASVREYCALLAGRGLEVLPTRVIPLAGQAGAALVYLVQPALPASCIGNALLRTGTGGDFERLFEAVLECLGRLWEAEAGPGEPRLGVDGQISNWAWLAPAEGGPPRAVFLDVGTPFVRRDGVDSVDAAIFLRAVPPPVASWLQRSLAGAVMGRYYSPRAVTRDLLANFIKEGRPERVRSALPRVNDWLAGLSDAWPAPERRALSEAEVRRYYRSDARTWIAFQALRRLERARRRLLGRPYEFVLPGRIER